MNFTSDTSRHGVKDMKYSFNKMHIFLFWYHQRTEDWSHVTLQLQKKIKKQKSITVRTVAYSSLQSALDVCLIWVRLQNRHIYNNILTDLQNVVHTYESLILTNLRRRLLWLGRRCLWPLNELCNIVVLIYLFLGIVTCNTGVDVFCLRLFIWEGKKQKWVKLPSCVQQPITFKSCTTGNNHSDNRSVCWTVLCRVSVNEDLFTWLVVVVDLDHGWLQVLHWELLYEV